MEAVMTEIRTERLILRRTRLADAERIHACIQDPRIHRNVGTIPPDQTLERTRERLAENTQRFDAGTAYGFAITEDGERLLGVIGGSYTDHASFDFGYWIAPDAWGKGYATEASTGLLDWLRSEHGVRAFTAGYVEDNPPSGHVLRKLGFIPCGRSRYFVQGRQEVCWSLDMARID